MPLGAGSRIGGYEIVALIGAGGMGEVYRARDARLGRDVALKVLAPRIAADANSLARFDREARALAALNHPNIASIYGVEDGAGHPALILELVDGETLADRLARGPLPLSEALEHARQIADALDAAHEAGIVHRDLKPGNIKITGDGRVKVLDFGLAKAAAAAAGLESDSDPAHSPTITVHGTAHGVILGTAAYMSPEQARGKRIDKRTDIWAFGCVLAEMLGGRRAFSGETTSDIIAAIIERAPDLSPLPAATPPQVRWVIERCLEKDPRRRARDIADVRVELDAPPVAGGRDRQSWVRPAAIAVVAIAVIATAAIVAARWRSRAPDPAPAAVMEFSFGTPAGFNLTVNPPAPSPDGRRIAYIAGDERGTESIWIRTLDTLAPRRLEGTEGASGRLAWSPDGSSLAFYTAAGLKRVAADGGLVLTIVPAMGNLGASWNQDGVIILAPVNRGALLRVAASGGGAPTPVTTLDPNRENSHRWPHFLPDGRHFLFTVRSDKPENQGIKVGSLDSGEVKPLINVASPGVYVEPGWILYVTPDAVLMAQRFDSATLTITGQPLPVAANVRYNGPSAQAFFGASRDGSIVTYLPRSREGATLTRFDRGGRLLGKVGPQRPYGEVRLSPDGRSAATVIPDERYGTRDVWIVDLTTGALTRATTDPATDWRPVWSPDGAMLAFASDRAGLSGVYRRSMTTEDAGVLVYRGTGGVFPTDWSRDGARLLLSVDDSTGRPGTLASVGADGTAFTPIVQGTGRRNFGRLSPDGTLMAFNSDQTGAFEVYVVSVADGRRTRVSTAGGFHALWGRDGRELFFVNPSGDVMRSEISARSALTASPPTRLFTPCGPAVGSAPFGVVPTEPTIDVTSDATRFLAICESQDSVPSAVVVNVDWQSRLR